MRSTSTRCGVSAANWPANQTTHPLGYIHPQSEREREKKKVSRQTCQTDLTRAKAGRPPTRTHANSHFIATPGHQSLLLPCIPGSTVPYRTVVIAAGPLARPRAKQKEEALEAQRCFPSNWGPPMGLLSWAWGHGPHAPVVHGPWLMGHGTMCRCHPTTGIHHHIPVRSYLSFAPLSHQIPEVESTASHDHLNVSIRPEFRAEEARCRTLVPSLLEGPGAKIALGGHAQSPKSVLICQFLSRVCAVQYNSTGSCNLCACTMCVCIGASKGESMSEHAG